MSCACCTFGSQRTNEVVRPPVYTQGASMSDLRPSMEAVPIQRTSGIRARQVVMLVLLAAVIAGAVFAGMKANAFDTKYVFIPKSLADLHIKGILIGAATGASIFALYVLRQLSGEPDTAKERRQQKESERRFNRQGPLIGIGLISICAVAASCGVALVGVVAIVKGVNIIRNRCCKQPQVEQQPPAEVQDQEER